MLLSNTDNIEVVREICNHYNTASTASFFKIIESLITIKNCICKMPTANLKLKKPNETIPGICEVSSLFTSVLDQISKSHKRFLLYYLVIKVEFKSSKVNGRQKACGCMNMKNLQSRSPSERWCKIFHSQLCIR